MALTISTRIVALSLGGAPNPAFVSHSFLGVGVIQELAAKVALYHRVVALSVGVNSAVQQISYKTLGPTGPTVDIPFPVAEYAVEFGRLSPAYQASVAASPAYGVIQTGDGPVAAAPRGTSLCMVESTATKSSAGRHFLPDISRTAFNLQTGDVLSVVPDLLNQAWRGAFLGESNSIFANPSTDSGIGVWSPTNQTFTEADGVRCSTLGSLLQSRKR